MIESYNGRWQARVWAQFHHPNLEHLQDRSLKHVQALRQRRAARAEAVPARRPFPKNWKLQLKTRLNASDLRATNQRGG